MRDYTILNRREVPTTIKRGTLLPTNGMPNLLPGQKAMYVCLNNGSGRAWGFGIDWDTAERDAVKNAREMAKRK